MIKIFLDGSKMNAVDDKNNLVGFDTSDDCCAHGGWFVSVEKLDQELGEGKHDFTGNVNFPDYEFDTTYFDGTKRKDDEDADDGLSLGDDEGSLVRLRWLPQVSQIFICICTIATMGITPKDLKLPLVKL